MLTDDRLEHILRRLPQLTIGVLGDLFLDRYLDIEAALSEPSIETGLDAYQVTGVRSYAGAAGTVINNLAALGVGKIQALGVVGDDGEGYELRQALGSLPAVDSGHVYIDSGRRTPTYTKPLLHEGGHAPRELNRLDIKNRTRLPAALEDRAIAALTDVWPRLNALLVLDQVSEEDCGVVTARVREAVGKLAATTPERFVLADSRERIRLFRNVSVKPNERECQFFMGTSPFSGGPFSLESAARSISERSGRPVFCTLGDKGMLVANGGDVQRIGAFPVDGPIDTVGAGDSTSAAIGCAMAAGATPREAAAFGNLVASITIQQLGTTGTASPEQARERWREVHPG